MQFYDTTMTSKSNPLRIDEVAITSFKGKIGISICPGKKGASIEYIADYDRDIGSDLDVVKRWGAKAIVTLIEDFEFKYLGVEKLSDEIRARGMRWYHLPIEDGGIPDEKFSLQWEQVRKELLQMLQHGDNILIHCRGGLGRAGMVSAILAMDMGLSAEKAITVVRQARPGAIGNYDQEEYIRHYEPTSNSCGI